MKKLSVVIPAYNESVNIKKGVLEEVYAYLSKQKFSYEVVIVDDASVDDTVDLVKKEIKNKAGFRLLQSNHGGKAITVMKGLLHSQGDIALFTDMDQATPINQIEKLLPKFDEGYDIVIGKRIKRTGAPLIRQFYSFGFVLLRSIFLSIPFTDTQCGFKAFNRRSIEAIFPKLLDQWEKRQVKGAAVNAGFDIETLYLAHKIGFKVIDAPVEWHHVGSERVGLKAVIEALEDLVRIRLNSWLGRYK